MAAAQKDDQKTSPSDAPESPTTARPLEMDDDDVPDPTPPETSSAAPPSQRRQSPRPPAQPARPLTYQQKNIHVLKEAFPSIDEAVVKAVLTASGGQMEPAFNALLQMTDPEAVPDDVDEQPPPPPPRPAQSPLPPSSTPLSQLQSDEMLARELARQYESAGAYEARTGNQGQYHGYDRRQQPTSRPAEHEGDRERSFLEDELPIIKENLRKGFRETQSIFNDWVSTVKKKIDGEFEDPGYHDDGPKPGHVAPGRRRPGGAAGKNHDFDRYDADPQVVGDDFAGLRLSSDGTPLRNPRPVGLTSPSAIKSPARSPAPSGRKVAFKEEVEDIREALTGSSARPTVKEEPAAGKPVSKWQPLSIVEPGPLTDTDPFSLGDSEDEKDSKDKADAKPRQVGGDDVQAATAEAMADSLVRPSPAAADGKKA